METKTIAYSKATSDKSSDKSVERWIKKHVHARSHDLWLIPPPGMAAICEEEFWQVWPQLIYRSENQPQVRITQDALVVSGLSIREIFELAYRLRTVRDLYWQIATAKVKSIADLKKVLRGVHWSRLLSTQEAFQLEFRSYTSRLFHEAAILELLSSELSELGLRLSQDQASQRLRFHLKDNRLHVLVGLSDQPHYRRGLRSSFQVRAPLAEHYAAALIHWYAAQQKAAGRELPGQVYIPFAGSGTFAWELITWFYQLPPTLLQQRWVSEDWPSVPHQTLGYIRKILQDSPRDSRPLHIRLCERSSEQSLELQSNLERYASAMSAPAWLPSWEAIEIDTFTGDFFQDPGQWDRNKELLVLLNPPYGLRLNEQGAAANDYGRIAERLNVLAKQVSTLTGLILVPSDDCYHNFQHRLAGKILASLSWNQGGKHVRAILFFLA